MCEHAKKDEVEKVKASRDVTKFEVGSPNWKANMTLLVGEHEMKAYEGRTARIYQPARSAMQSMEDWRGEWRLEVDKKFKEWNNPLMGWASTKDPLSTLKMLSFKTAEEAKEYADYFGIKCTIIPANESRKTGKSYASNFKWKGPPSSQK